VDCCSLEGRALKAPVVAKILPEFVIVRLEPVEWDEDREFGARFGITKFPWLLVLDPSGERKLGDLGDAPEKDVAAFLRAVLSKRR
jgi:hypothetical protein